ncbi:uncharacterized protein MONBRDRAFT_27367 [Monosiga brevicollis MX1]|uniref:Radical S-adenosyl methionine domain-containing protein 1, mitochondrial n=1 Tax=Monosiga brevicollis TaxID=81824 RepID=A9V530_MONBE|nr:uncharacterized protein MONBRDRAFT_27367 [Monosiga brevicollis MX1]EDQ87307.1 predicted protein [Monosiga brevicollis MX1]|eukprot:XP_001747920.1 hypothetical protein [Monosiga brevicollis MX1]
MAAKARALAVYVHWPFCSRICTYCDFVKYPAIKQPAWFRGAGRGADPTHDEVLQAYRRQLTQLVQQLPSPNTQRQLTSLYFGGGTPSLMSPSLLRRLVDLVYTMFPPSSHPVEITLEANPDNITRDTLARWQTAGINRLSIGVQAIRDPLLQALGRQHSAEVALRVVKQAQDVFGSTGVSLDLMFGLPGQALDDWCTDLDHVLTELKPAHMSIYELTVKRGTILYHQTKLGLKVPDPDDYYFATQDICSAHGLERYEVSNYAQSPTMFSRHNMAYWRGTDYLGIGPGAVTSTIDLVSRQLVLCYQAKSMYLAVPSPFKRQPVLRYQQVHTCLLTLRDGDGCMATLRQRWRLDGMDQALIKRTMEEAVTDIVAFLCRTREPFDLAQVAAHFGVSLQPKARKELQQLAQAGLLEYSEKIQPTAWASRFNQPITEAGHLPASIRLTGKGLDVCNRLSTTVAELLLV